MIQITTMQQVYTGTPAHYENNLTGLYDKGTPCGAREERRLCTGTLVQNMR